MDLYMAAMTREAATSFDFGDDSDDDDAYDTAMSVFSSEGGLEVEKAWDAVNAIVSVDLPELDLFWAGEAVTEDLGYGPAFFASADDVRGIAARLSRLTEAEVGRRFDAALSADALGYPGVWDRVDEAEDNKLWIIDATMQVIALYERAAVHGLGMFAMLL
jgi:hypothetical protein